MHELYRELSVAEFYLCAVEEAVHNGDVPFQELYQLAVAVKSEQLLVIPREEPHALDLYRLSNDSTKMREEPEMLQVLGVGQLVYLARPYRIRQLGAVFL